MFLTGSRSNTSPLSQLIAGHVPKQTGKSSLPSTVTLLEGGKHTGLSGSLEQKPPKGRNVVSVLRIPALRIAPERVQVPNKKH